MSERRNQDYQYTEYIKRELTANYTYLGLFEQHKDYPRSRRQKLV